jgi:hypothetical protein
MPEEERETRRRKQEFAHVEKHGCAVKLVAILAFQSPRFIGGINSIWCRSS